MIAIIILNWNGWRDTNECIKSILKINDIELSIIVVDNGSTDNSTEQIITFTSKQNTRLFCLNEDERLTEKIQNKDVVLLKLRQNYGFAKGNNLGLKMLAGQQIDYYWILNNDTVVDNNSIDVLKTFMENNNYDACTPQIRFYSPNNRIWNCGGKLLWGFRKYYFAGKESVTFKKDFFDITFVTGCALFIKPDILDENNCLFTEKFFFGEEDFEFSLRMKSNKKRIACCTKSIIYHKVSASTKRQPKLGKIYIYYLNRFINVKHFFSNWQYGLWRLINNIYITMLLLKNGYNISNIKVFLKKLNKESLTLDEVSKETFERNINSFLS